MNLGRQQLSLIFVGGLFFAVVTPVVAIVAPVLPIAFIAIVGIAHPGASLLLPFALGSVPGFIAGLLFVYISSRISVRRPLSEKQSSYLASFLCAGCFIIWFLVIAAFLNKIHTLVEFGIILIAATLLSVFAAIGGFLSVRLFVWFIRRIGAWPQSCVGGV